jgi:hypothetical protein
VVPPVPKSLDDAYKWGKILSVIGVATVTGLAFFLGRDRATVVTGIVVCCLLLVVFVLLPALQYIKALQSLEAAFPQDGGSEDRQKLRSVRRFLLAFC